MLLWLIFFPRFNFLFGTELMPVDSALVLLQSQSIPVDIKDMAIINLHLRVLRNALSNADKERLIPILHSNYIELPKKYGPNSTRIEVIQLLAVIQDSTAGEIFVSAYNDIKKIMESDTLSESVKHGISFSRGQALFGLVAIGDPRAESLALECISGNDALLVDAAVGIFSKIRAPSCVKPLLQILKEIDTGRRNPVSVMPIRQPFSDRGKVIYTLTQIGKPALPYLAAALTDSSEIFRGHIAVIICRIGSDDSLLNRKVGTALTNIIEVRKDSLYLEEAVRGIAKINYREGLPAVIAILVDEKLVDRPMRSTSDFPFIPNRAAIHVLKQFGLNAEFYHTSEDNRRYFVVEFDDLEGKHHKVMMLKVE